MESNELGLGLKGVERGPCIGRWQLEGVVPVEGRKNPGDGIRDACCAVEVEF